MAEKYYYARKNYYARKILCPKNYYARKIIPLCRKNSVQRQKDATANLKWVD
jgi:hypothetical protein